MGRAKVKERKREIKKTEIDKQGTVYKCTQPNVWVRTP